MPANDILSLASNEGASFQGDLALVFPGLSLAFLSSTPRLTPLTFAASGDLRNLVRTINELPADYSGELKVVLNDHNPYIVARNLTLLLLLATTDDPVEGAEIALHYWYSAFVPFLHTAKVFAVISDFLAKGLPTNGTSSTPLTPTSILHTTLSPHALGIIIATMILEGVDSPSKAVSATDEFNRIMFVVPAPTLPAFLTKLCRLAPARVDYRDRFLAGLKPSHRVAYMKFRRSGLVLPFGAGSAAFDTVNRSLFSPEGQWLQNDSASPLHSWK